MYSHTWQDINKTMKDKKRVDELLTKETILKVIAEKFKIKILAYRDDRGKIPEHYFNP